MLIRGYIEFHFEDDPRGAPRGLRQYEKLLTIETLMGDLLMVMGRVPRSAGSIVQQVKENQLSIDDALKRLRFEIEEYFAPC